MKNYYEILEIEKTAEPQEIKRAYFGKVRIYPPERFPNEFKELRAAYETLSDTDKRAEYDKLSGAAGALPEEARLLYESAGRMRRQGRCEQAETVLLSALESFPKLAALKSELAGVYEDMGKIGKASSVWDELCGNEPENTEYILRLANAYTLRGWRKKAIERYNRAISIDGGNADAWIGLISCHAGSSDWKETRNIIEMALNAAKKKESVKLYTHACVCCLENDDAKLAEAHLRDIADILLDNPEAAERDGETASAILLDSVMSTGNVRLLHYIKNIASLLPVISDYLRDMLNKAELIYDIEAIEDNGFSVVFHDMLATASNDCDCEECRNEMAAMECEILLKPDVYRPQMARLKKEAPKLYSLHAAFFDEALLTRNPDKMLYKRARQLSKSGLAPSFGEDYDETPQQTVRRESPKVGRNDPCPCGSGKKYKRCCGA